MTDLFVLDKLYIIRQIFEIIDKLYIFASK